MERRDLLKTLGIGAAGAAVPAQAQPAEGAANEAKKDFTPHPTKAIPTGSPTDPNLLQKEIPWDLVLTAEELETVTVLADLIIPADDKSPAASEVGVPAFINEWVSAPYPHQQNDLERIRGGIAWLNTESIRRYASSFIGLKPEQQTAICDDICSDKKVADEKRLLAGVMFFARFRDLVAGGFYTTPAGFKDLGYMGNVPNLGWKGPTPEARKHLGIEDVED